MSSGPDKANSILGDIKDAAKGIHGVGESIRGTFNESIDHAAKDREGEAKNRAVADKGAAEMRLGERALDTKHGTTGTTTGAGAHSGAVGNMQSNPVGGVNTQVEPEVTDQRY